MKKSILLFALFSAFTAGFSATLEITNSGSSFTPDAITINLGDNVNFTIESSHNVREVSQATWNANGSAALTGGFSLPFGGGLVPASKLTAGIHYYVCVPHASSGMKGTITVINTTGIADNLLKEGISVYPNPSNGNFQLTINNPSTAKNYDLGIYDALGNKVYSKSDLLQSNTINVELPDRPRGPYFIRFFDGKEAYIRKIIVR
jgi:plastocyanin